MTPFLVLLVVAMGALCLVVATIAWRLYSRLRVARANATYLSTELRRVEGETLRLETVRRDFVANISHELRTPLASIKLLVETLETGALDDHEVALNFTHKIGEETNHLIGMAEELLDLARLDAAPALQLRPLDPAWIVTRAAERMRELARDKGVALRADLPPRLPCVAADEVQVGRVFVNLLTNAITFTPRGGSVTMCAQADERTVAFSVVDTGPGIPAGEESRVFERFYKVDTARRRGGTGLGLSIARRIVEAHGGRIWARNSSDAGACFAFTLPVADTPVAGRRPAVSGRR